MLSKLPGRYSSIPMKAHFLITFSYAFWRFDRSVNYNFLDFAIVKKYSQSISETSKHLDKITILIKSCINFFYRSMLGATDPLNSQPGTIR